MISEQMVKKNLAAAQSLKLVCPIEFFMILRASQAGSLVNYRVTIFTEVPLCR